MCCFLHDISAWSDHKEELPIFPSDSITFILIVPFEESLPKINHYCHLSCCNQNRRINSFTLWVITKLLTVTTLPPPNFNNQSWISYGISPLTYIYQLSATFFGYYHYFLLVLDFFLTSWNCEHYKHTPLHFTCSDSKYAHCFSHAVLVWVASFTHSRASSSDTILM